MARKPNYDFERKERQRLKNEKNAARAEAKNKVEPEAAAPDQPETQGSNPAKD